MDVLQNLKAKIDENPVSIKSSVYYNHSTGDYNVDGDGIIVLDEDVVAKEALVFMVVSFRGHWEYPVGYVLDDKVNADDLNCLLSRILTFCAENNIKVRRITMDGTVVNFNAMKLFRCKLGRSLEEIDGAFIDDAYDYKI